MPPAANTSAAEEAIELGESAGIRLDEWQKHDLRAFMGETAGGTWAAFECVDNCPRQNGKNVLLEVRELWGLYVGDDDLIIHTAHEFKTCKESFRRLLGHIEGSRDLVRKVRKVLTNNQETSIELTTGRRIKFIARRTNTGRGFTADLLVFDEAFALQSEAIGAVLPTLSSRPNPQVWYTSSAGFASSDHFKGLRTRGLAGDDPHLAYVEWSAPDEAIRSMDDRRWWWQANPAMGIRISEEFVSREFAAMSADLRQFARERLGIWSDEVADTVISPEVWRAAEDATAAPAHPLVLVVDVHGDNDAGAIVVCDGSAVEVVEHRTGADWLSSRTAEVVGRHRPTAVGVDVTGPARSLVPDLERQGVPVVKLGATEMAAACGLWLADLADGRVKVRPHPGLAASVKAAQKKATGDLWVWRRGDDDVSPLVAATGSWWLSKQPAPQPGIMSLAG